MQNSTRNRLIVQDEQQNQMTRKKEPTLLGNLFGLLAKGANENQARINEITIGGLEGHRGEAITEEELVFEETITEPDGTRTERKFGRKNRNVVTRE